MDAGGVLVHCVGGRSRSAAFISAFLMSSTRLDYNTVVSIVKRARPVININRGFEAQLRAYSQSNYDVYLAQQILLRGRIRALYSLYIEAQQSGDKSSSPSGSSLPVRKRSKDFTNDEMLLKLEQDKAEDEDDDRHKLRLKKTPGISVASLRSVIPLISPKTPICRLTRPGSGPFRVIPPLRGVGREFCCSWCAKPLFNLANVVRLDIEAAPLMQAVSRESAEGKDFEPSLSPGPGLHLSSTSSPMSDSGRPLSFRYGPLTSRNNDRGHKGFDFKEGFGGGVTGLGSIEEYKSESKDSDESDCKNREEELELPPSHPRRPSRNFSISGPIDDDDTWSVVSSEPPESKQSDSPPTRRSSQTKNSVPPLQSRSSSPGQAIISYSSFDTEDSPRIPIPPHRLNEHFSNNAYRPQSAEKSRWLARVSLLREGARSGENGRVARLAQDDEEAVRLGWGAEKYIYLEYLEWMGSDLLQGTRPRGPLCCSNCHNILGSYDWNPNRRITLGGRIEPPVFRLHKSVIHEAAIAMDATPMSTPRAPDDEDVPMES